MQSYLSRILLLCTVAWAGVCLSGCAANGLFFKKKPEVRWATQDDPAVRMLCMWEPGEGKGHDDRHRRGFCGRIYFFSRSSEVPVAVAGDVRIYLFDDQGDSEEQTKPLHRFDFVNGSWQNFLRKTGIGPAYDVFVPYVRDGNHMANCSLRVKLVPAADGTGRDGKPTQPTGPVVSSDMAQVTLRGTTESMHVNVSQKAARARNLAGVEDRNMSEWSLSDVVPPPGHKPLAGNPSRIQQTQALTESGGSANGRSDRNVRTASATEVDLDDDSVDARIRRVEHLLQAALEQRQSDAQPANVRETQPIRPAGYEQSAGYEQRRQDERPARHGQPGGTRQPARHQRPVGQEQSVYRPLPNEWNNEPVEPSAAGNAQRSEPRRFQLSGNKSVSNEQGAASTFHPLYDAPETTYKREPAFRHMPDYRDQRHPLDGDHLQRSSRLNPLRENPFDDDAGYPSQAPRSQSAHPIADFDEYESNEAARSAPSNW